MSKTAIIDTLQAHIKARDLTDKGTGLSEVCVKRLFNGVATAFDQRGWGSLKYYDSNNDNKIDRSDAVFKLLRLWVDINGDGTAGTMETFTLDMDYVGVDMAKLKASLDAAGQQALAALQQLKVQSIDLSTMKFKLADGSQVQASTEQLRVEVLGTQVWATEKRACSDAFRRGRRHSCVRPFAKSIEQSVFLMCVMPQ
jgi:hypothetical protein